MSDDEECELPHSDLSETNLDFLQPSENWKPRPAFLRMFGPSAEPPLLDLAQEDDDDEPLTLSLAKEAFAQYHGHQWLIKMEADAFCNVMFSLE